MGCGISGANKPDLCSGYSSVQASHGRMIILIHLECSGLDIDGNELTFIIGMKQRTHAYGEQFFTQTGEFIAI